MVGPLSYFSFQPVLHSVICMWDGAYKRTFAANPERVAHVVTAAGFLSRYVSGPLPYV